MDQDLVPGTTGLFRKDRGQTRGSVTGLAGWKEEGLGWRPGQVPGLAGKEGERVTTEVSRFCPEGQGEGTTPGSDPGLGQGLPLR